MGSVPQPPTVVKKLKWIATFLIRRCDVQSCPVGRASNANAARCTVMFGDLLLFSNFSFGVKARPFLRYLPANSQSSAFKPSAQPPGCANLWRLATPLVSGNSPTLTFSFHVPECKNLSHSVLDVQTLAFGNTPLRLETRPSLAFFFPSLL